MAEPIRPAGVTAFGNESWFFAPAVASITAPTVAEITAVTGLELTCRVYRENSGQVSTDSERLTRPARLCDTEEYDSLGSTKVSISDVMASFDPQATAAAEGKKAFVTLNNASGFLIRRMGLARTVAPLSGQFVDVMPVQFGPAIPGRTGDGKEAEFSVTLAAAITGPCAWNKAIV